MSTEKEQFAAEVEQFEMDLNLWMRSYPNLFISSSSNRIMCRDCKAPLQVEMKYTETAVVVVAAKSCVQGKRYIDDSRSKIVCDCRRKQYTQPPKLHE